MKFTKILNMSQEDKNILIGLKNIYKYIIKTIIIKLVNNSKEFCIYFRGKWT